uniref:Uncharacterized protein n=1 Tax=Chrysemys picta bellii TaxID=8478 RepID=A0A8C3ITI6_CHRPI
MGISAVHVSLLPGSMTQWRESAGLMEGESRPFLFYQVPTHSPVNGRLGCGLGVDTIKTLFTFTSIPAQSDLNNWLLK